MGNLDKFISILRYYFERAWPWLISFGLTALLCYADVKLYESVNFNSSVNAIVTVDSIIIGFVGALMPMIISMKNESKFVQYVFEKDKNYLFKKYFKIAIKAGFFNLIISIILFVREVFKETSFIFFLYLLWVYTSILFFGLTLRSMNYMMELIFDKDVEKKEISKLVAEGNNSEEDIEATRNKYSV